MNYTFADKLKVGDEIRVIAPSRSMSIISHDLRSTAKRRFDEMGLKLTFGKHVEESDDFLSSSIESRVEDLHEAFLDPNVKGILSVIGGFNSNQLLNDIDWSLIQSNPKIFCGFSDITIMNNSILKKTGLVTYSGLHYSTFGMEHYFDYSYEYFKKCLFSEEPIEISPSTEWTDDEWYINQHNRAPIANKGWLSINDGKAKGTIIGGNIGTFNLLQGTEFMPDLAESILFIEDDEETNPVNFDRALVSIIQQPDFSGVRGIVIGRFQLASKVSDELLRQIVSTKKELKNIPVIANVDFGHTNPMITYPVGGHVEIVSGDNPSIKITRH